MFKEALKSATQVVFSIEEAWDGISKRKNNIYKDFLIPLWVLIVAASFVGGWLVSSGGGIEMGVKNAISELFVLFVAYHISSFFLNEYTKKLTDVEGGLKRAQTFIAYSSSLIYLINIAVSFVNDFFFLWLFALYTFYIVYIGAEVFYKITAERRTTFMIITTLVILVIPVVLRSCLSLMMS